MHKPGGIEISKVLHVLTKLQLTGMSFSLMPSRLELAGEEEDEPDELEPESLLLFFASIVATGMMMASKTSTAIKLPTTMRFFLDQFAQNFQNGRLSPLS